MIARSSFYLLTSSPEDDQISETDAIVEMKDGNKYVATFCSFDRMRDLLNLDGGVEDAPKHYLHFQNLVLVKELTYVHVADVIEEMIDEGDFQMVFKQMTG